ncbi:thyroid adenoma-associated, putative [Babesia ovis]|uniref:Thyroid adenoma-associated, putative n=1 Tax=Babesia ovis TaxID=5869 RepID=A0A9W5WU74_BABOV|nr:thyroid adenoma-associated, putative [Babesia ovis]
MTTPLPGGHKDHLDNAGRESVGRRGNITTGNVASDTRLNNKIPAFSKCSLLRTHYDALLKNVSINQDWTFDIRDISHELPRGQIAKALFDLEQYIRDSQGSLKDNKPNVDTILGPVCVYVLQLFLEAEWLCLSRGFSSSCTSLLRSVDARILSKVVSHHVEQICKDDGSDNIHRRISDLHALAQCVDILCLIDDVAIIATVKLLLTIGLDTEGHIEESDVLSASDTVTYHKSRIYALKALNLLLYHRGPRTTPVWSDNGDIKVIDSLLCNIVELLSNQTADRDVVCQCGASFLGLLYVTYYVDKLPEFQEAILQYLGNQRQMQQMFEGDESMCLVPNDSAIDICDFSNTEELVSLIARLPCIGHMSIVRGILTFIYSIYGKVLCTGENMDADVSSNHNVAVVSMNDGTSVTNHDGIVYHRASDDFVIQSLSLCHKIFKTATDTCLRVDVNYATLQGVQLLMSFITRQAFHCDVIHKCLDELPELIFTFWTRKVRRISNLAVATWNKLMDLTFALKTKCEDVVIAAYAQTLVNSVTNAFSGNLKLRYLVFQNLLRYIGPEQILSMQPYLIPHLMDSLTVPAIKGSATVLLTEVLQKVYDKIKEMYKISGDAKASNTPLIVLQCLVYPEVIAIMHCKQLNVPAQSHGILIPKQHVSKDHLDQRSYALAESFKNVFGKIHKDYVCEMLRLSTAFTECNFFRYLPAADQERLSASTFYNITSKHCLLETITELIQQITSKCDLEPSERIIHLEAPFNFTESVCLWNARALNSVNFVDTEIEGKQLKGVIINDSPGIFKFDTDTLSSHPQVRLFYIPLRKLKDGLLHIHSDISINVLKSVACCPKTKQPLEATEMKLMLFAMHHCMKTSLPSYRQHFVAAIKPFIRRLLNIVTFKVDMLKEALTQELDVVTLDSNGFGLIEKDITDNGDKAQANIIRHCAYIRIVFKMLGNTINPCTSDFRNTTALEIIHMTLQMFSDEVDVYPQMVEVFAKDVIVSMFLALFYMSTRQQDLIMKSLLLLPNGLLRNALSTSGHCSLSVVTRKAVASLWSIKSMPYIAGAKALTLLLRDITCNDSTKKALKKCDIGDLLMMEDLVTGDIVPDAVLMVLDYLSKQLDLFCKKLDSNVNVMEPDKASSPAGLLSLISHYMDSIPINVYSKVVKSSIFPETFSKFYNNIKTIIDHVLKYVGHESDDAIRESKDYQIDCRGHLIAKNNTDDYGFITNYEKHYIDCCLCTDVSGCFRVRMLTTPKCSIPDDSNLRPFTVLCWKSIFECCSAMQSILQWILPQSVNGAIGLDTVRNELIVDPGTDISLFYDTINDIGRYIIAALMTCRHFGCTDAFADLMTWICRKLVIIGLQKLLQEWLNILLEQLRGNTVDDEKWNEIFIMLRDSHRRSEPIARSFTSILKAESDRHKPVLLPFAIGTLLQLCKSDKGTFDTRDRSFTDVDIRIHSLNILCAIFRSKELRWSNNIHAGDALCASLCNMSHGDWSVRNSAALLFSSVLHHITGSEVNVASTDALLDQKLTLCYNAGLSNELNRILVDIHRMTVESSESYENLNPVPEYSALYQSSAFVFNFLIRIPLYTFPADVTYTLTKNIGAILFSTNASIRIMAAKLIAKNYIDTSQSNLSSILVKNCSRIIESTGKSNCINGMLMLVTECLDIMIDHGLHDIWGAEHHGDTMKQLTEIHGFIRNDQLRSVIKLVEMESLPQALLLTMYFVAITANCFENVVQTITILEKMCLLHAKTTSYDYLIVTLSHTPIEDATVLVECITILVLVASYILGDDVLQRCRQITGVDENTLIIRNGKLQSILTAYARIRDDDTVKLRAAACLVDALFILNIVLHQNSSHLCLTVFNYIDFVTFFLRLLNGKQGRQRVLQAAMERVEHLLQTPQGLVCDAQELEMLWDVATDVMNNRPHFFLCTGSIRLFNAIGQQMLRSNIAAEGKLFDEQWSDVFTGLITEQLLHNTEFFIETWKCCHIYCLLKNNSEDMNTHVHSIGAGLILKAIDPASEIAMRMSTAAFLKETGIPKRNGDRYNEDATGMYVTHVMIAMLVMLQDENEELRAVITACCARILNCETSANISHVKAHVCIEYMLEFAISKLPPVWLGRLFHQLTMLTPELYKEINYGLELIGHQVLERGLFMTTVAIADTEPHKAQLDILAEMDTVFNVEPQNMYTETLLYMVHVDRVLCKLLRSLKDTGVEPIVQEDTIQALHDFVGNSAEHIMTKLQQHMTQNYGLALSNSIHSTLDIENIPLVRTIAMDPLVVTCALAGFTRSAIYAVWQSSLSPQNEVGSDGTFERVDIYRQLLNIVGHMWTTYIEDAYISVIRATSSTSCDRHSTLEALAKIEQLLNLF